MLFKQILTESKKPTGEIEKTNGRNRKNQRAKSKKPTGEIEKTNGRNRKNQRATTRVAPYYTTWL